LARFAGIESARTRTAAAKLHHATFTPLRRSVAINITIREPVKTYLLASGARPPRAIIPQ
jgi:hypothetical protein